ncbi:MAG TPA: hypothetical protein VLX29_05920 [Nitrospirota bacterium]|nr:hypothetical protein [Nitrospirota bacterium]
MSRATAKNPALDAGVKKIMTRPKDLDAQLGILGGKSSEGHIKPRPRACKRTL